MRRKKDNVVLNELFSSPEHQGAQGHSKSAKEEYIHSIGI